MYFIVLLLREKTSDDFLVPRVRGTKLWTGRGLDGLGADEGRRLLGALSLVNKAPTGGRKSHAGQRAGKAWILREAMG